MPLSLDLSVDAPLEEAVRMADALHRHASLLSSLLRIARSCGRVAIVTLAKEGWVETSMRNFLPGVADLLAELGIEVFYARNCLEKWKIRSATMDDMDVLMLMKQAAMKQCIKRLYGSGSSWKNIMSIGDSETERNALTEVVFTHSQPDRHGQEKTCRCKTIKVPDDPNLQQLSTSLEVLTGWIQPLILHDGDLNLDFSNTEESLSTFERVLFCSGGDMSCSPSPVTSPHHRGGS
jgi:hypothetical protein